MNQIKVFISSAMKELASEREIIEETINSLGMKPIWFESDAGVRNPLAESLGMVADSDIVLVTIWKKYSEVTNKEHEKAKELNKPIFIMVKTLADDERRDNKLKTFIDRVKDRHTYKSFRKLSELKEITIIGIQQIIYDIFLSTIKNLPNKDVQTRINEILQSAKELYIFSRTPILLFGPREYLTNNKIPYEAQGYKITKKLVNYAKHGIEKFHLIVSSASVIEEIKKCSDKKKLAMIVLKNLNKYLQKQTNNFKIVCTPVSVDIYSYLTYVIADDIVIIWVKTPHTNHCILTNNSELAYTFKYLSDMYLTQNYMPDLIAEIDKIAKGI